MHLLDLGSAIVAGSALLAAAVATEFGKGFRSLADAVVLPMGIIGALVGAALILAHLDDPTQVNAALSVAFLTHLYAAILKMGLGIYAPDGSERVAKAPGASGWAAVVTVTVIIVVAALMHNSLGTFFNLVAVLLCALGAVATVGLTKASGRTNAFEKLVHTLPWVGMLILYGSGIVLLRVLEGPTDIGPVVAVGLLGSLYALLGSVLLQLIRPDLVGPHPPYSQWLVWASSSVGIVGIMGLIVVALT